MKYFALVLSTLVLMVSSMTAQENDDYPKVKLEFSFDISHYSESETTLLTDPYPAFGIGKTFNFGAHFFIKKNIALTIGTELGDISLDEDALMDAGAMNTADRAPLFKTRIYQGLTILIPQSDNGKWNFDGTVGAGWVSYRFPTFDLFTNEKVDFSHVSGMNLFVDIGVSYRIAKSLELNLSLSQHMDLINYSVIIDGSSFDENSGELFSNSLSLGLLYSL